GRAKRRETSDPKDQQRAAVRRAAAPRGSTWPLPAKRPGSTSSAMPRRPSSNPAMTAQPGRARFSMPTMTPIQLATDATANAAKAATILARRRETPVETSSTRGLLALRLLRGQRQRRGLFHGLEHDRRARRGDRRDPRQALAQQSAERLGVASPDLGEEAILS